MLDQLALQVTAEDLAMLGKVTSVVYQRAARFIAVGIAAILKEVIHNILIVYGYYIYTCVRLKRKILQLL